MATVIAKLGDDISTDVIYPGRYMATVLPTETPQFAFADSAELNGKLKSKQVPPGSVIAAGKNFGCGSSREQACSCLKGYELTIVARRASPGSSSRTRSTSASTWSPHPTSRRARATSWRSRRASVVNKTTGKTFATVPLPKARQAIIDAGGLIAYTRKRVMEAAGKA